MRVRTTAAVAAVASLALFGAACSSSDDATTTEGTEASASAAAESSLSIADQWVKAEDGEMSAAFGIISNSGDEEVTIVSATTATAAEVELHETVDDGTGEMMMQVREGGFVVPAGGELVLEPGGNHIMLIGLTEPIDAGAEIAITLTMSDGSTMQFTAPAKEFSGANEEYDPMDDMHDHGDDMDMDDHDGDDMSGDTTDTSMSMDDS